MMLPLPSSSPTPLQLSHSPSRRPLKKNSHASIEPHRSLSVGKGEISKKISSKPFSAMSCHQFFLSSTVEPFSVLSRSRSSCASLPLPWSSSSVFSTPFLRSFVVVLLFAFSQSLSHSVVEHRNTSAQRLASRNESSLSLLLLSIRSFIRSYGDLFRFRHRRSTATARSPSSCNEGHIMGQKEKNNAEKEDYNNKNY